jgi:hypothetical protein
MISVYQECLLNRSFAKRLAVYEGKALRARVALCLVYSSGALILLPGKCLMILTPEVVIQHLIMASFRVMKSRRSFNDLPQPTYHHVDTPR